MGGIWKRRVKREMGLQNIRVKRHIMDSANLTAFMDKYTSMHEKIKLMYL